MAATRILVVEDDAGVSHMLALLLQEEGYDVTQVDSALGAVELVRRLHPSAILLDLGLPYRSGATLLREMKDQPDLAHIPVIIISGMTESLTSARRELAAAVLPKPFSPVELLERLRTLVAQAEATAPPEPIA